jgi:hypothetical protein
MAKLYKLSDWRPGLANVYFHCPGCNCEHGIWTEKWVKDKDDNGNPIYGPVWNFNGDMDKPTFSPSILIRWVDIPGDHLPVGEDGKFILQEDERVKGAKDMVCHSFVRDGKIEFLGDCTHKLAGQTIEMEDIK